MASQYGTLPNYFPINYYINTIYRTSGGNLQTLNKIKDQNYSAKHIERMDDKQKMNSFDCDCDTDSNWSLIPPKLNE